MMRHGWKLPRYVVAVVAAALGVLLAPARPWLTGNPCCTEVIGVPVDRAVADDICWHLQDPLPKIVRARQSCTPRLVGPLDCSRSAIGVPAVNEDVGTVDHVRTVGSQEYSGSSDLVGVGEAAGRDERLQRLTLGAGPRRAAQFGEDDRRRDRVDGDAACRPLRRQ